MNVVGIFILPPNKKELIRSCAKIIFNSEWSKKQFLKKLDKFYHKSEKLEVIHQSINKEKVDINKKDKLITFVGKLNSAKGCLLYTSPSPRDRPLSRMPSSA